MGKEGTGPGMWAPFYAGKGVEIRFSPLYLLEGMKACPHGAISPLITHVHAKSLQSCPTLCDPMDCSPPGSSVRGILQARILEQVAVPSSGGIFPTQGSNLLFLMSQALAGRFFTTRATWDAVRWWTCVVLSHQACVSWCVSSPKERRHGASLRALGWLINSCTQHLQDTFLGLQSYESYLPPMNTHTHAQASKAEVCPNQPRAGLNPAFIRTSFSRDVYLFWKGLVFAKDFRPSWVPQEEPLGLIDGMAVGRIVLHWLHPLPLMVLCWT